MGQSITKTWQDRHEDLIERARRMKAQPVVDHRELTELKKEIRALEHDRDRPLPEGIQPIRLPRFDRDERPGRAPTQQLKEGPQRRCPFGSCDGSGWHLHEVEDIASPCKCQRLPRDSSARRQTSRILRRHLALSLDIPPLAELASPCVKALRDYSSDLSQCVASGRGLWFSGVGESAEAACAFLAGEALRREVSVLLYPGDELIGRLRRLAADDSKGGVDEEIYKKLAGVDLLLLSDLDAAASPSRYPEKSTPDSGTDEPGTKGKQQAPYEPGMTETDLSRLFQVVDERLMNQRATIITTSVDIFALEELLLRVPGEWPSSGDRGRWWDEAQRRASNLRRLISRLMALCGQPLQAHPGDIHVYRKASDRKSMLAG